jgi:hypothetical protein
MSTPIGGETGPSGSARTRQAASPTRRTRERRAASEYSAAQRVEDTGNLRTCAGRATMTRRRRRVQPRRRAVERGRSWRRRQTRPHARPVAGCADGQIPALQIPLCCTTCANSCASRRRPSRVWGAYEPAPNHVAAGRVGQGVDGFRGFGRLRSRMHAHAAETPPEARLHEGSQAGVKWGPANSGRGPWPGCRTIAAPAPPSLAAPRPHRRAAGRAHHWLESGVLHNVTKAQSC